jgi:hypothetical protein
MNPRKIRLHIQQLVLHDIAPGDRGRIADAFQTELHRLLTEQGLPASVMNGANLDVINAGEYRTPTPSAHGVGTSIARALYGGLKRCPDSHSYLNNGPPAATAFGNPVPPGLLQRACAGGGQLLPSRLGFR